MPSLSPFSFMLFSPSLLTFTTNFKNDQVLSFISNYHLSHSSPLLPNSLKRCLYLTSHLPQLSFIPESLKSGFILHYSPKNYPHYLSPQATMLQPQNFLRATVSWIPSVFLHWTRVFCVFCVFLHWTCVFCVFCVGSWIIHQWATWEAPLHPKIM